MTDLLDELKAKVEAATALVGEARAEVSQAAIGPIARPLVTRLADALAESNKTNRRLTSEEGVEQLALAIQAADQSAHREAEGAANGLDQDVSDWGAYLALAALNALLSDSQP